MMKSLPDLPPNVSENILQSLTCKDICNLAHSCKAFWALTCQQQNIEFRACSDLSVLSKAKSLSRYLQNRGARGLQVQNLSITLDGTRSVPLCGVLAEVIWACSKSLRRLSLHNVVLESFSPPAGPFLVTLKECKRLARLNITLSKYHGIVNENDVFMQDIVPALPQLKALQVMPFRLEVEAKLLEDCLVHTDGATQEPGLQLLAMQQSKSPLPTSLRCLFLRSSLTEGLALGHLSHLEECYINGLAPDQYTYLLKHGLAAVRQSLRAFVLTYIKCPLAEGDVVPFLDMPRLQVFAMPNMLPVITGGPSRRPVLQLRCPQLRVFVCEFPIAEDALCLLHLLIEGAPHLQTLQVSFICEGGDVHTHGVYGAMWRSLKGAHCLQNLHVVFRRIRVAEVDKQVKDMLKAAMEVEGLCLPKLSTFNIYLRCIQVPRHMQDASPGLVVGVPFQGALAIIVALRDLVAKGITPALTQVGLHPCRKAKSNNLHGQEARFYGPLPHMVSLPQVKWEAISQPGHMLEHPDWTGPDQDMLQRALVAITQCKPLDETLGTWDYRRPLPAHDAAIDYTDIHFCDSEDDGDFYAFDEDLYFAHLGHLVAEGGYDPYIDYDAPEFADDEDAYAYGQHADFFF
ncbi:hypothetical protein COCOBI_03-8490 [Coccomyxa sp. Obi]|nr:hypothetical protein COCOBI_03-8490 [Coccomyxa sp. Obi]